MVTFGPQIENPHSPNERVLISSVESFCSPPRGAGGDIAAGCWFVASGSSDLQGQRGSSGQRELDAGFGSQHALFLDSRSSLDRNQGGPSLPVVHLGRQ